MDTTSNRAQRLREAATLFLAQNSCPTDQPPTTEIHRLIEELQIYQTELEIQNDELRLTQQSVEMSRMRYQKLFENAPIGYMVLDGVGIIREGNQRLEKMLNVPLGEIKGRPFSHFLMPDSERLFRSRYRAFFAQPANKASELELVPNGSETRIVRVDASHPLENDSLESGVPSILVAVIDITESWNAQRMLKEREKQLRQAEKMEAIGHLAGGIAHDFNNILAAILGYADLTQLAAKGNSEIQDNMEQIVVASERARDLVRQILTFGRPQKGFRQPIYLRNVIQETLTLLRAAVPSSIQFEIQLEEGDLATDADATAIHEIVMNLGTNAVHAMGEKGTLVIRLKDVAVQQAFQGVLGECAAGLYSVLSITDDGSGIPEKNLEQIFDPYFTTRSHGTGSGMGLSVVFGLVRQHDGNIVVKSIQGKGTTFEVYFPKNLQKISREPRSPARLTEGGSERILLIDDEAPLAMLGRSALAQYGYSVDSFTDPEEAIQHFKTDPERYDIVLTDQSMPKLTGLEVARNIRKIRPIPVVLCTGYAQAASQAEIEAAGISCICNKPVHKDKLARKIRKILNAVQLQSRAQ